MYGQCPFSEQKQSEARVKEKETHPTWSQNSIFPITRLLYQAEEIA